MDLITTTGPPPYDVQLVMFSSIGSIIALGVLVTCAVKRFVVGRLVAPAERPPMSRLAVASVAEGALLVAALYMLQIPISAGTGTVVALLAFMLLGGGLANGWALWLRPASRRMRLTALVTLIYPAVQSVVAVTLGPPLGAWFVTLFP